MAAFLFHVLIIALVIIDWKRTPPPEPPVMTVELVQEEPPKAPEVEEQKKPPPPIPPTPLQHRESGGDPDKAPGNRPDVEKEAPTQRKEEVVAPAKAPELPDRKPDVAAEQKAEPKKKEPPTPKSARHDPTDAAPKQLPSLSELIGEGGGDRYLNAILADIAAQVVYPPVAAALSLAGIAEYKMQLDAKGNLVQLHLIRSTGVGTLDDAGIDAIRRAAPFPPIPAEIGGQLVWLDLKIPLGPNRVR